MTNDCLFVQVTGFFESYGWFILIGAVVAYILYQKLKEKLASGPGSASSSQAYTRGKSLKAALLAFYLTCDGLVSIFELDSQRRGCSGKNASN